MPEDLLALIRQAVAERRYVVGKHARLRLLQRKIRMWQVESGTVAAPAGTIQVRRDTLPNPTIIVPMALPDGADCKAVWAWVGENGLAKLVTVFLEERPEVRR